MSVYHDVNQHVVQALVETRLLHWQIMTQPVAIRMTFARRVRTMSIRCPVVIVAAIRIGHERDVRPFASNRFVRIMPATSKQSMDEQRSTQQATKKGTHHAQSQSISASRRVYPGGTAVRHPPYSNFRQTKAAVYIQNSAQASQSSPLAFHPIFGPQSNTVN